MLAEVGANTISQRDLFIPLTGQRVRPISAGSLFHTLFVDFFSEPDLTTYVQTGDIPAMWLRDSSAQTIPYVRFARYYPILRERFAGVIARNARNILTDPYANAFMANYHIWERKWEIDSLAYPVMLTWIYWRETRDRSIFTPKLYDALRRVVITYRCEQHHAQCSHYSYPYRVPTAHAYSDNTGLIWGAFRPSDDAVTYRFNIPQNALAAVALEELAQLAVTGYHDPRLAANARSLSAQVQVGIARYGRVYVKPYGWIYAYEVDGLGDENFIDDANLPNLISLPYSQYLSGNDPTYLNTRAFALSKRNPYYYSGYYASGLGSPHTPAGYVWPLGIISRALTASSAGEAAEALSELAETDSKDGLIHESFYPGGYWRFTRAEFGWANALYGELIFRSVAGFPATPFAPHGTILPFERASTTPRLVSRIVQLENSAYLIRALGQLLYENRAQR